MNNIALALGIVASGGVGGAGYYYVATPPGEYYAVPLAVAYARVAQEAETAMASLPTTQTEEFSIKIDKISNQEIRWKLGILNEPFAEFAASFAPDGAGTRIDFNYVINEHGKFKNTAKVLNDSGLVEQAMEISAKNYFAKVAEGKDIDQEAVFAEMKAKMGSTMGQIKAVAFFGRLKAAFEADMAANGLASKGGGFGGGFNNNSEMLDESEGSGSAFPDGATSPYQGSSSAASPTTNLSGQ